MNSDPNITYTLPPLSPCFSEGGVLTVTAPETMNTDVLDIMGEIFARFVTRELKKNRPGAARRLIRYVQRDMQPNALRVASQRCAPPPQNRTSASAGPAC
jgi:hypothetical protein